MKKIKAFLKASHRLQEFVLRGLLFALRLAPKSSLGLFCSLIALIVHPFSEKDRKKIARNIDHILGIPSGSKESKTFQDNVLRHQIYSSVESFKASYNHDLIQVEGLEEFKQNVQENMSQGHGLVVTTGHLGSWELCAYYISLATGERFNALAKPSKLDAATRLLDDYRSRMNTKTLWTNQRSLLKSMTKIMESGEALGFVMDQRPDGRKGPIVNFMGRPTQFAVGPAWVSIRNSSPIMGVFCVREGPWKFRLLSSSLLPANHGETDTEKVTQIMAAEIERVIRLYPEQWVWNYNRWQFQDQE